ncbi:type II secretion system F family protein [Candidatus Micrarchaeota archaeon]|nr:type II secretion system F family protein [Candidatus Micrarchaeota archaeon]
MANAPYERIGRLFTRKQIRGTAETLDSAGINMAAESYMGFLVVFVFLSSILVSILSLWNDFTFGYLIRTIEFIAPTLISNESPVLIPLLITLSLMFSFIIMTLTTIMASYVFLMLRIDDRRKKMEEFLPDFLLLAAANVRGGMNVDQALWYAAKPEFGLLSLEVELVARRTFGGEPVDKALDRLGARFASRSLNRAISLIKQGMATGGEIANILERTGEEARETQIIKKEISTSLLMYVIFIAFAAAVATPFLFAVAHQLLMRLEQVFLQVPDTTSFSSINANAGPMGNFASMKFSQVPISSDDFFLFSILTLLLTVTISSLIIGVIQHGEKKEGLKFFPLLLVASVIIYFIIGAVLTTVLRSLTW